MAKEKEDIVLGEAEINELDAIAEYALPEREEIVEIFSTTLNRKVSIRRGDVYKHASCMSSIQQVANILGIDKNTVKKHFSREITMAHAFARQKLLVRFFNLALYGNNPADRIFALKNWANMSDQGVTEDLADVEDGVKFNVSRPQRPIETLSSNEDQLAEELPLSEDLDENA